MNLSGRDCAIIHILFLSSLSMHPLTICMYLTDDDELTAPLSPFCFFFVVVLSSDATASPLSTLFTLHPNMFPLQSPDKIIR